MKTGAPMVVIAMKPFNRAGLCRLLLGAACSIGAGGALAQAALAADQVPGERLQLWLNQGFSYAGVDHGSGCYFMGSGAAQRRVVFIDCPNGDRLQLDGTARVDGNAWCTKFPAPVGSACTTWHQLPDGRFTQKSGDLRRSTGYVLSIVPLAK